jgi:16S rRNA G966 N2-methylase RsmD
MNIINGDNLEILRKLEGEKFDLVELDGPYMAGLEDWDNLTEAEYIRHYAERLSIVRRLLHPWGVVFVFGYPEGCADVKVWAETCGYTCRRWLSWYKQSTAHAGRRIETILVLMPYHNPVENFHQIIKDKRLRLGLSKKDMAQRMGVTNGRLFEGVYERFDGKYRPNFEHFMLIMAALQMNVSPFWGNVDFSFEGLTDIDFLTVDVEKAVALNDDGLRSKPIGLYQRLFSPLKQPIQGKRALILYGGSGNAAIAAEALGYDVTVIEKDPERCKLIEKRAASLVKVWRDRLSQGNLFSQPDVTTLEMFSQALP